MNRTVESIAKAYAANSNEEGRMRDAIQSALDEARAEPRPSAGTVQVALAHHENVRKHSLLTADVPVEMLANRLYFDENGQPTDNFAAWMWDNGTESGVEYDDCDDPQVFIELENITPKAPGR